MDQDPGDYTGTLIAKGTLLDGGTSGIVELRKDGYVVKSPWPGEDEPQCRQDMEVEARVYEQLYDQFGNHDRFLKLISFDTTTCTLTMDYMRNGTLRKYLETHSASITYEQRCQWALAAAQGLLLLHSLNIIHCDFTPKNMLLDDKLELKVVDFGCSSVDGAASSGGGDVRSYPSPIVYGVWKASDDVFALGSTIYEIFVGKAPYHDTSSRRVQKLVSAREMPTLGGIPLQSVIQACWQREHSAAAIHAQILELMEDTAKF